MLKPILTQAGYDALDDATKAQYKKGDAGVFILEVEGMVSKEKLDEFRDNNTKLQKDLEALQQTVAKFSGLDLDKYNAAMAAIENDQEKKLIKEGKIDEVINLRTEKMRQSYDDQIKAKDAALAKAKEDATKATGERNNYIVEAELRKAVNDPESGFQPGLADLVKGQALKEFVFKDDKVVRVKSDGSPVFGASGNPATMGEFLTEIAKNHPYLVKGSNGSGAPTGKNNAQPGQKTMKRGEFDAIVDPVRKSEVARSMAIVD